MKNVFDEFRMLLSEWLLSLVMSVLPKDRADAQNLIRAIHDYLISVLAKKAQ